MDFVFNDSTQVSEDGLIVVNEGLDATEFMQNPVCLYEHGFTDMPSVGRWSNLRIEGSKYIATLTFDDSDPFALDLKRKYEAGFMTACSKSFVIDDCELLDIAGRTALKVTKWRLKEISLVNVGANAKSLKVNHSLKAYKKGDLVKQTYQATESLPIETGDFNNSKQIKMKRIFLALGISESATEEQAVSAINKLLAEKSELQKSFDEFKAKVQAEKVDNLITEGIKSKKITALEGEKYKKLALLDFESVKDIIEAKEAYKPANELIEEANAKGATTEGQKKERPTVFKPSGKSMQERMAKELAN
jgi:hypothetical protein